MNQSTIERAETKLARIIAAEGDMGGQRRERWYLEALVQEESRMDLAATRFDGGALQYAV